MFGIVEGDLRLRDAESSLGARVTIPGTSAGAGHGALAIQGVAGGVPIPVSSNRLGANEAYLERWGVIDINSPTDTLLSNATGNPNAALYSAQNIDYTVPVGKLFYLKEFEALIDGSSAAPDITNVMVTMALGSAKKNRILLAPGTALQQVQNKMQDPGQPWTAGQSPVIYVRCSYANAIVWVRFEGIEVTL